MKLALAVSLALFGCHAQAAAPQPAQLVQLAPAHCDDEHESDADEHESAGDDDDHDQTADSADDHDSDPGDDDDDPDD